MRCAARRWASTGSSTAGRGGCGAVVPGLQRLPLCGYRRSLDHPGAADRLGELAGALRRGGVPAGSVCHRPGRQLWPVRTWARGHLLCRAPPDWPPGCLEQAEHYCRGRVAGWELLYFAYSWSVGGKTFGMAGLGIEVVRSDGADLDPRRAAIRTLALPLSFLLCGLGFAGILFQREHRALHDLIAGTAVV